MLTTEQINGFQKNGFIILRDIFSSSELDDVISECAGKYVYKQKNLNEERRIQDAWVFSQAVHKVAVHSTILSCLEELFKAKPFPFQTLNFEIGTEQPLHSDSIHFNSYPKGLMAGVWVALEDVDVSNGPLTYVPGSHSLPELDCNALDIPPGTISDPYKNYGLYEEKIREFVDSLGIEKEIALMSKGDLFIWHSNLIHGGTAILDAGRTRVSQVTHYFFEGCVYYTPLTSDLIKSDMSLRQPYNVNSRLKISIARTYLNFLGNGFSHFQTLRKLGSHAIRRLID